MRFGDLFEEEFGPPGSWTASHPSRTVRTDLVLQLASGPIPGDDAVETAIALTQFVRGEYQAYGTDRSQQLDDLESREAIRSLRAVLRTPRRRFRSPMERLPRSAPTGLPTRVGTAGRHDGTCWQNRLEPVLEALERAQDQAFVNELTRGVSPRKELGWPLVDDQIEQLRHRFATASTPVDYKDLGNRCVGVLEALSALVYEPDLDCPAGAQPPPADKTDLRIGAYIDRRLPGSANEELRGLVKKGLRALAQDEALTPSRPNRHWHRRRRCHPARKHPASAQRSPLTAIASRPAGAQARKAATTARAEAKKSSTHASNCNCTRLYSFASAGDSRSN